MIDLQKPPDEKTVEKIAWYLMGPVKFVVVYLIFFGCFVLGALFFQYIHQFVSFEIAIVLSELGINLDEADGVEVQFIKEKSGRIYIEKA